MAEITIKEEDKKEECKVVGGYRFIHTEGELFGTNYFIGDIYGQPVKVMVNQEDGTVQTENYMKDVTPQ
jgi:hypothetical protein